MNEWIRDYIKSQGMTYTFVAGRALMDVKKLSRILNNKKQMTVEEYEKICIDGLKIHPKVFFEKKFLETKNKSA